MVFAGSPRPQIYILHINKFRMSHLSYWNWKSTHPQNYIFTNKQKTHNPQKLAPMKLNDSAVLQGIEWNLLFILDQTPEPWSIICRRLLKSKLSSFTCTVIRERLEIMDKHDKESISNIISKTSWNNFVFNSQELEIVV